MKAAHGTTSGRYRSASPPPPGHHEVPLAPIPTRSRAARPHSLQPRGPPGSARPAWPRARELLCGAPGAAARDRLLASGEPGAPFTLTPLRYISPEMEGCIGNIVMILDLADPARPQEVGRWWMPGQWVAGGETPSWSGRQHRCHHPIRLGDRLYVSYWHGGFVILDIEDMARPRFVSGLDWSRRSSRDDTALPVPFDCAAGGSCWPTRRTWPATPGADGVHGLWISPTSAGRALRGFQWPGRRRAAAGFTAVISLCSIRARSPVACSPTGLRVGTSPTRMTARGGHSGRRSRRGRARSSNDVCVDDRGSLLIDRGRGLHISRASTVNPLTPRAREGRGNPEGPKRGSRPDREPLRLAASRRLDREGFSTVSSGRARRGNSRSLRAAAPAPTDKACVQIAPPHKESRPEPLGRGRLEWVSGESGRAHYCRGALTVSALRYRTPWSRDRASMKTRRWRRSSTKAS